MVSKAKGADAAQGLIQTIESSVVGLTQMVEDVRFRITELKQARQHMEETRVSKGEALQRLSAWLEKLQATGAVAVRNLTYREAYEVELIPPSRIDGSGYAVMTEAAAAMAYFFHDLIHAKLAGEIDAMYAGVVDAVASTDFPRRLAEIDASLLAAEIEEEQIIQRAEESGLTIHRRLDVNPRVLLEA